MSVKGKPNKKKWPRKILGEMINFLEEVTPEGLSLGSISEHTGCSKSSISNLFVHDDMKLSKAEEIAEMYGYTLRLFFPERRYEDGYVPAPPKKSYPDAGNLKGLVKYIQDSEYSINFVAERNNMSSNVLNRAFKCGDISLSTLYRVLDSLNLCVLWRFEKTDNESDNQN